MKNGEYNRKSTILLELNLPYLIVIEHKYKLRVCILRVVTL